MPAPRHWAHLTSSRPGRGILWSLGCHAGPPGFAALPTLMPAHLNCWTTGQESRWVPRINRALNQFWEWSRISFFWLFLNDYFKFDLSDVILLLPISTSLPDQITWLRVLSFRRNCLVSSHHPLLLQTFQHSGLCSPFLGLLCVHRVPDVF